MTINIGDYILDKNNELYRIIDIFTDSTGTYYDIKSLKNDDRGSRYIQAVPRNHLRHMVKEVIPQQNITKTYKILYG